VTCEDLGVVGGISHHLRGRGGGQRHGEATEAPPQPRVANRRSRKGRLASKDEKEGRQRMRGGSRKTKVGCVVPLLREGDSNWYLL
jgi:hypothetical protein